MVSPKSLFARLPEDGYGLISADELASRLEEYDVPIILDIRKESDWRLSRIPGSIHCEWEDVGELIEGGGLPEDQDIAVVCYVGQSSGQVTGVLRTLGYAAYSVLDGFEEWIRSDRPIENGDPEIS